MESNLFGTNACCRCTHLYRYIFTSCNTCRLPFNGGTEHEKRFSRKADFTFVSPCWIIYNIVYGAYAGILNELIAVVSIVIGIYRNDIKKKNELHDEACMN
ncbi:MAG: YgjV family protein [Ruminococcaceae bacterium]|nr:YgjV family protein [Oscillospiraceae bacterium]